MTQPSQLQQPQQLQYQQQSQVQQPVQQLQVQQPMACTHPALYYPGSMAPATGMTVLLFAPIGTWKTTWASMWPSPVFLSCGSEGGDDSLGVVSHIWGIPTPPTFKVSSVSQMKEYATFIVQRHKQYGWKTLVVDSLTFYVDTWIQDLITLRYVELESKRKLKASEEFQLRMTQADWGLLELHIMKELVGMFHNSGMNVIWTCLVSEKTADDGRGNKYVCEYTPDITGATKRKLPGVCKMVIYGIQEHVPDPSSPGTMRMVPKYYVRPPNPRVQMVRHRYGPSVFPHGYLVDPQYGAVPTFEAVRSQIGNFIVQ